MPVKMLLFLARLSDIPPPWIFFSFVTELPAFTPLKDSKVLEVSANVLLILSLHRGRVSISLVVELYSIV